MTRYEIVWRILTLHCDEASKLSSESLDHPLESADRVAWRLHLLLCGACRGHRRDILALRRLGQQAAEPVDRPVSRLPDEARERIKQAIERDRSAD